MRVRLTDASLDGSNSEFAPRPIPRLKKGVMTSLCGGNSISYAYAYARPRAGAYSYAGECFCLSPEHHGLQFHPEGAEEPQRGHC